MAGPMDNPPPFGIFIKAPNEKKITATKKLLKKQSQQTGFSSIASGFSSGGSSHPAKSSPPKPKKSGLSINVKSFKDPDTGKSDDALLTLKVGKHAVTPQAFSNYLGKKGIALAPGHGQVILGGANLIAVVVKSSWVKALQQHPDIPYHSSKPYKPIEKWTSAGGVVFQQKSEPGPDHIVIVSPKGGYGGVKWTLPKGRVDKGESVKQAAVREVWEETGIKARIRKGRGAYIGKGVGSMSITHFFAMDQVGGHPRTNDEMEKVIWVTLDRAEEMFAQAHNKRDLGIVRKARSLL